MSLSSLRIPYRFNDAVVLSERAYDCLDEAFMRDIWVELLKVADGRAYGSYASCLQSRLHTVLVSFSDMDRTRSSYLIDA